MWYSIKTIIKPKTLAEAYQLNQEPGTVILGGGTYLNAERNSDIDTLVDINELIGNKVTADYQGVFIDGRAALQSFLDTVTPINPDCKLLNAVRYATPSKNIRHQRTFGGELGQNRQNSDILVFIHAVNAELTIFDENEQTVLIRDWNGNGIVKKISYYPENIHNIEFTRYAVIPSAPSIISAASVRLKDNITFTIGGKCRTIQSFTIKGNKVSLEDIQTISKECVKEFADDQYGSLDYKKTLIETVLKRTGGVQ